MFCIYEIVLNALVTIVAAAIMGVHLRAVDGMELPPNWLIRIMFLNESTNFTRFS